MLEDSEKSKGETGGKYYQDILCICKKLSEGGCQHVYVAALLERYQVSSGEIPRS